MQRRDYCSPTVRAVDQPQVRLPLRSVLAVFVELEQGCRAAGMLDEEVAERVRDARIELCIRVDEEELARPAALAQPVFAALHPPPGKRKLPRIHRGVVRRQPRKPRP